MCADEASSVDEAQQWREVTVAGCRRSCDAMEEALSSLNVRARLPDEGCSLVAGVVNHQAYFGESSEHGGANNSRLLTTTVFVIKPSNLYAAALVPMSARRGVGWVSSNALQTALLLSAFPPPTKPYLVCGNIHGVVGVQGFAVRIDTPQKCICLFCERGTTSYLMF